MKAKGIAGTLKGKFLLLYVGLILIPFLCLSVFVIFSAIHLIETNLYYSSQLAFQQTHQLVSYYMHHVNYAMNTLLSDEHLCEIIEQDNESKTLNQQVSDMLYIRDLLSSYRAKDEIEDVTLYVPFQAFYIGDASPIQNMGSIRDETWYLYAECCYPKQAIIPPQYFLDGNKISLAKFIRSSTNYTQSIGMVRFDIALSDLEKLLGKSGHTDDGYTYLVNSRQEYVAQNQKMDFLFLLTDWWNRRMAVRIKYQSIAGNMLSTQKRLMIRTGIWFMSNPTRRSSVRLCHKQLCILSYFLFLYYLVFYSSISLITIFWIVLPHSKIICQKRIRPCQI